MGRIIFYGGYTRLFRLFSWTMAILLGVVAVISMVFAITLSNGPLSLDFAVPHIEEVLSNKAKPYHIKVEHAELSWDEGSSSLIIKAKDLHVQGLGTDYDSVKLPNLEFKYNLLSLFRMRIIPSEITVLEPHLHLYQGVQGNLYFSRNTGDQDAKQILDLVLADSFFKSLKNVNVKNLNVDVQNLSTGEVWSIPSIDLRLERESRHITCDFDLVMGDAKLKGTVAADLLKKEQAIEGVLFSITARLVDFNFDTLDKFWPRSFAHLPRDWIMENLSKGLVTSATLEADWDVNFEQTAPKVAIKKMGGEIHFHGLDVRYFGQMPVVNKVSGVARYTDKIFDIKVLGGHLENINVQSGRVYIDGLDVKDQTIQIDLDVKGSINTALKILDAEPLFISKKLGVKLQKVEGSAEGQLHFDFPLETSLTLDDVNFRSKNTLKNVSIKQPLGAAAAHDLKNGQFNLEVDRNKMTVKGKAQYASIPVQAQWEQNFNEDPKDWKSKYQISADLLPENLTLLGYGGYTQGPLPLKATVLEKTPGSSQLTAEFDFTRTLITLPGFLGVHVPGHPGKALIEAEIKDGKLAQIKDVKVTGQNIKLHPKIVLDQKTKGIKSIDCPNLVMGRTNLSLKLSKDKNHQYHLALNGESLDLESIIDYVKLSQSEVRKTTPFHFTGNIKNVWYQQGKMSIKNLQAKGSVGSEFLNGLEANAQFAKGDISISHKKRSGSEELSFISSNAGEALQLVGLTPSVRDGSIELLMTKTQQKPWVGKLKMKNFHVNNAPVVTHILSLASPFGIIDAVRGKPMAFSKFSTDLSYDGNKIILTEGSAEGMSIGFTVSGEIDRGQETLNIQGTILPYNAINIFLSKIPLVGTLLGGKGGGILGLNYGLSGSIDEPTSYVNPLSVLTPGILRSVFPDAVKSSSD